jgi:hypothetical protein
MLPGPSHVTLRSMNPFKNTEPMEIEPSGWSEETTGGSRVLVENPDAAQLWAHADVLREAGYTVATCPGPLTANAGDGHHRLYWEDDGTVLRETRRCTVCPLVEHGHCELVEKADVVVTTTQLPESDAILARLRARSSAVVLETVPGAHEDEWLPVTIIDEPVTPESLLAAVGKALEHRAG